MNPQRPQVYTPAQRQEQTQLKLVDDLIQKGFGGSAMKLVLRAVSAKRISTDELAEIRRLLGEAKGEQAMNLHDLIASPLVYRLGWTLLHSLWQGGGPWLAWSRWPSGCCLAHPPTHVYLVALAGLLLSLALPAATFQLVSVATPHLAPLTIADQLRSQSALSRASTDREGIPLAPRGSAAMIPSTTDEPSRSPAVLAPSGITQPSSIAQIAALAAKLEPAFPCLVGTWILGVLSLSLWHLGGWIAAQRLKSLELTRPTRPLISCLPV